MGVEGSKNQDAEDIEEGYGGDAPSPADQGVWGSVTSSSAGFGTKASFGVAYLELERT